MAPTPPPALPDELVEEILLRLPPGDPACLLRASVVCKTWGCAVSSPRFRRRLHELHRTPPVLGFLHNWYKQDIPRFIPTTSSSFSLAAPDRRFWRAIDCRHGRALFLSKRQRISELLVWEPITGAQRRMPVPASISYGSCPSAAVLCAADGCNHRDCHGGPFHLVFVFNVEEDGDYVTSACRYSSETGAWGESTSMYDGFDFTFSSSVLVRRSLLYFMSDAGMIVEYDLPRHSLNVFDPPDSKYYYNGDRFNLMLAEDGQLGLSQALDPHLKLWSRKVSDDTNAQWELSRVIYLENLLPNSALVKATSSLDVLGFAEGANVIFLNTIIGLFSIELQSERARKVCDDHGSNILIPVVSFYTPVPRREHQDPSLSGPGEEACREERGEVEKTVYQAQQLFDKGSNTIKEGGLVNAFKCVSHNLEIRDPCYREVAPECASMEDKHGHALPSEAQEITAPLGDVSNSALNEELVKSASASSKDNAGNSKTSGSNVGDAAPTSEKGVT